MPPCATAMGEVRPWEALTDTFGGLEAMKQWFSLLGKARKSAPMDIVVACPLCQASVAPAGDVMIEWNETMKRFEVQLQAQCGLCRYAFLVTVKMLPLVMAQHPACACGSRFALADRTLQKTADEWTFEATYVCPACAKRKRVAVGKVKRALATLWRHTTHVEIGPTGVTYAKSTSEEEHGIALCSTTR